MILQAYSGKLNILHTHSGKTTDTIYTGKYMILQSLEKLLILKTYTGKTQTNSVETIDTIDIFIEN